MTLMTARIARAVDYHTKALLSRHYYGNQMPWQRSIRRRHWQYAASMLHEDEMELVTLLHHAFSITGRDPNVPNGRHSDALFLLGALGRARPMRVLECGAGISTLIIAYALDKLHDEFGHLSEFVSFDESAQYIANLVLPGLPANLWHRVTLMRRPIEYWRITNRLSGASAFGIKYEDHPRLTTFDFVYVDGPQVRQGSYENLVKTNRGTVPDGVTDKPFDCDALWYASQSDITAIIDQRLGTKWAFQKLLDGPYEHSYHYAARKSVFKIGPENVQNLKWERIA